jgi:hypothetical protein
VLFTTNWWLLNQSSTGCSEYCIEAALISAVAAGNLPVLPQQHGMLHCAGSLAACATA